MIRMAVIGRGWIVDKWIGAARKNDCFTLAGAYSRKIEDARAYAQANGAKLAFDSKEALCASDAVDGVYIASPILMHGKQAMALLKAGKHVMVEKPMTVSLANAQAMFQAAQDHHVVLMEGLRCVHTAYARTIKANLSKLGEIHMARLSYCQYSSKFDAFKAGELLNTFNAGLGNGALMDLGVYLVEGMAYLFGEPEKLSGQSVFLGDWEAAGTLIAGYKDMQVSLSYSKISSSAIPSEIQGEKGTMVIEHFADGGRLYIRYRNGEIEELAGIPHEISLDDETRDFFAMVNGVQPDYDWQRLSLTTAKLMEQARQVLGIKFPENVYEL